jgi:glycosyltransferase involved in cell wall biosynthesis
MQIAIDYTAAAWQSAGIGRYTRELVRALVSQDAEHRYTLFYAAGGLAPDSAYAADMRRLCDAYPHVRAAPIPFSPRRLTQIWQRLRLPLAVELFTGPIDLLHAPDFVLPPTRARTLLTIHDLAFLRHPECFVPSMVRYLSAAIPRGLRRADLILADSVATRADLAELLAVDAARVTVVYPGVGPQFRPLSSEHTAHVRRRLNLPEQFLLFVGTLEPRKNLTRLIEAFALLKSGATGAAPSALDLVIAGRRGWLYEDIFATIERLGLREQVHVIDFVHDNDLPSLYNLAWALAYPSIYEGFGLPALEALACGTPVVTADNSSLPEVVGESAVLVAADNVESIAAGLARVVGDSALRDRLRAEGPVCARQFSWEQAARQVLACYERVSR